MILRELHSHTSYCDGKNTPEEMVLAAIEKGLKSYGFSEHGYTFFDDSYCLSPGAALEYEAEIRTLKEKYKDKIEILLGIEQDVFSDCAYEGYDYIIGSVHYIKKDGKYRPIDESAAEFENICREWFDGDYYAMAEDYYRNVAMLKDKNISIAGHLDLITKFNEGDKLFDTKCRRYLNAAFGAIDALLPLGIPFEINTGALSRGYRTEPYPALNLIEYIKSKGGGLILTSDTHSKDTICFQFDKWEHLL